MTQTSGSAYDTAAVNSTTLVVGDGYVTGREIYTEGNATTGVGSSTRGASHQRDVLRTPRET